MQAQLPGVEKVMTKDGEMPLAQALEGVEFVAIYFSAHWCPPCRGFTPVLSSFYEEMNKDGKKFEVIFVSSDQDEAAFKDYFASMPFKACSYEVDRQAIKQQHGVQGIPMLPLFKVDGTKLSDNARGEVHAAQQEGKQAECLQKWRA